MYKVFFNDYLLHFRSEKDNSSNDNIGQVVEIESIVGFVDFISHIERRKHVEKLKITCLLEEVLLSQLPEKLIQIPASGGLVKNRQDQLLFIKRFGRWDLPKGKIEKDESVWEAALREVAEECGLDQLQVLRQLPSTIHMYRSPHLNKENNLVWKETAWFEMFHSGNGDVFPQSEESIEEVRWFSKHELNKVYASTYGNLKELLNFYLG